MSKKSNVKNSTSNYLTIDEYLASPAEDVKNELQRLQEIISNTVPDIKERIAYKICVFSLNKNLGCFAFYEKYCSF